MEKYTILLPYFKEKCYFEYMKKILLFASLLLVCSCNGSISGSKSLSSRGRLLSITENVSYYIKYDTRTYEVIIEFDYEKHEEEANESRIKNKVSVSLLRFFSHALKIRYMSKKTNTRPIKPHCTTMDRYSLSG